MKMPNGACGPIPDPTAADIITPHDVSNVLELYAREQGWMPFRSIGRDIGPTQPLSAEFVPGVKAAGAPALAIEAGPNLLHMVVRGSDGQLWHRVRRAGGWRDWVSLGGSPDTDPAVAAALGGLVVAARQKNGAIGTRVYRQGRWGPWIEIAAPADGAHSGPAVTAAGARTVHLFVRGKAEQLLWLKSVALDDKPMTVHWSDEGGRFTGSPAAVQSTELHVVVGVASKNLWHWRAGAGAKPWSQLGCCLQPGSTPAVAAFSGTEIGVVARGPDDTLQNWFWHAKSGWTRARAIGGLLTSSPGMAGSAPGGHSTLDVLAIGTDATLKQRFWRR
jgi:hypothetical protein